MLLRCLVIDLISSTKSCIVDKAAGKWINQFRKAKKKQPLFLQYAVAVFSPWEAHYKNI